MVQGKKSTLCIQKQLIYKKNLVKCRKYWGGLWEKRICKWKKYGGLRGENFERFNFLHNSKRKP